MITAVGMVDNLSVMACAVIAAVGVMLFAAKPIGEFVDNHPSIRCLLCLSWSWSAWCWLAKPSAMHVPKAISTAMAFSLAVESLNIRAHKEGKGKSEAGFITADRIRLGWPLRPAGFRSNTAQSSDHRLRLIRTNA